ncbi:MAG TPA: PAS domain-containing sensor histidine kinase [Roseiarcus sp.]|jgi:two-component system nitrogen regulation sensor histidine kinase NtrY
MGARGAALFDDSRPTGRFGVIVVGAAFVLALATFLVFAGFTPILPTQTVVFTLLIGDGLVVLVLLVLIGVELARLRSARRAARAGARLHSRFVTLFSLVAAIPAIVTAVVATVSVEWAINPRFMSDVASFINEANQATQLYRETQCRALLRDVELTAGDIGRSAMLLRSDPAQFKEYFSSRSKTLGFTAAALMKNDGTPIVVADGSDDRLIARPDPSDFQDAMNGEALCGFLGAGNIFVGIRPIPGAAGQFLYAARGIDPLAAKVTEDATLVSNMWGRFEAHRHSLELGFATVFVMLALTMLFSAIWLGLAWANRLVGPIRRLIRATDQVASGNLHVQVPTRTSDGDLGHLGDTFNKMTSELLRQQTGLMEANALNDERRAFIEAVLSGVPAGVLGVDNEGVVTISNAAAERLLGGDLGLIGRPLNAVQPSIGLIWEQARSLRLRLHQGQATVLRDGRERVLNVRVTGNPGRDDRASVITLDDISDLVTAQRTAAWADVARRIAHEIRNPLTPIQLSAERLKRRYGRHILEGRDVFNQCTDTIIRQVDDIKRMVDEFSSFARMPKARPAHDDLTDCVRQAIFLMRVGRPDIAFEDRLPEEPVLANFDRRLVSQALTNVLKNATEGIDALGEYQGKGGVILTTLTNEGEDFAEIAVSDNGKGFPREDRHRLIEPYVTTRAEGTGLGLPIVVKIFEDHGGGVELLDGLPRADGGHGAKVLMRLPLHSREHDGAQPENEKIGSS